MDTNSANGLLMDGLPVTRATLTSSDTVVLGDTTVAVVSLGSRQGAAPSSPLIEFNRSPRVVPRFGPIRRVPPAGPKRQDRQPFPYIMLPLAPLMMGAVLFAVTQNLLSMVFMPPTMPLFVVGHDVDQKMQSKREHKEQVKQFREAMAAFREDITALQNVERSVRLQESPSVSDTVDAIYRLGPLLWTHRPEQPDSWGCGSASVPPRPESSSRNLAATIPKPTTCRKSRKPWPVSGTSKASRSSSAAYRRIVRAGRRPRARGRGRPRHGHPARRPAFPRGSGPGRHHVRRVKERWPWLQWLPHVGSGHSPLAGDHLAAGPAGGSALLSRLEDLIDQREAAAQTPPGTAARPGPGQRRRRAPELPAVLVVDERRAGGPRPATRMLERGPESGMHVMWVAAPCSSSRPRAGTSWRSTASTAPPPARSGWAGTLSRSAAKASTPGSPPSSPGCPPVVDVGKPLEDDSDLPRAVSYAALIGKDFRTTRRPSPNAGPRTTPSAPAPCPTARTTARSAPWSAPRASSRSTWTSRRGPHALVGGTTGAGKSEFLQSWVLGMAAAYSPDRVNFLFVDYKGGAAFADCLDLPHTVGLVTDLPRTSCGVP